MPLSPADFYAYSRATGAPVADTPEDRAKQAPEVLAFQQNRLQAPKQGPGLLDVLGGAALLAGVGAGGYGIARALRNRGLGQAATKAAVEEITPQAVQNVRRAAAAPLSDPWGQGSIPQPPSSRYIPSAPWFTEAAVKPATVDLSTVSQVQPQERMVRRHGRMVPLSTVSRTTLTTTGLETPTLVEQHAAQQPLHTNQTLNALGASEDQLTQQTVKQLRYNPQVDLSGFGAFSKDASVITARNKNLQDAAHMIWAHEEMLEQLGQKSQALQAARNPAKVYTAEDLLGTAAIPGRTRRISYAESALPSSYGLTNTEVRDRIMAAGSASSEEAQLLLNPNVPTEHVRHLLGTTGGVNPTMEMRTHGQMGPTDYESFATRRLEEEAGPEVAQKFLEERLGTAGTVTGIREVNNPKYENLLFNKFIPHWDEKAAMGHLEPRNTTVSNEDIITFGLPPERYGSNMTYNERKILNQNIGNEKWGQRTGVYLSDLADAIGLSSTPQTILQESGGQPLVEALGFKERTNTGSAFTPGEVQEVKGIPTGSLRQERTKEGVLHPRSGLLGEQSTGVEVTTDPENPFVLQTEPITSTKLIGGYELPEATPHFVTGPAVAGQRPDIQISIKDNGQMVPIVKTQTEHFPVNRLDQIKYLPSEGVHQPGSQTIGIQPYMVGDLVEHEGQKFVVSKPVYGPLMRRMSPDEHLANYIAAAAKQIKEPMTWKGNVKPKGVGQNLLKPYATPSDKELLTPTTVDLGVIQNAAQTASSKWNSLGEVKLNYLANTGNEGDLNYLADHGYEVIEQRYPNGQTVNKAVAVRGDATDPNKLGEAYHHTGYVADQVHQYLLDTQNINLPVLQDPSAKHQFIGDVTNVTAERQVYGSPWNGEIQKKTMDPLNYGRYGRDWVEGQGYPTQQLPGRHRQLGLSGVDPMQLEEAGEAASEGMGVAFHTPRVQTTPARVTGDVPASRVLPSAIPLGQPRSREDIQNTLMNQAANRQEMMEAARRTPGGRINREALGTETNVLNKYGMSSAKLIEQANAQMSRSQQFMNQLPGARSTLTAQQVAFAAEQERANAAAQHMANYITAAAKRVEGPMTWQGDVKLKGVGQNRLMPYASPSEGMIQALINKARNR